MKSSDHCLHISCIQSSCGNLYDHLPKLLDNALRARIDKTETGEMLSRAELKRFDVYCLPVPFRGEAASCSLPLPVEAIFDGLPFLGLERSKMDASKGRISSLEATTSSSSMEPAAYISGHLMIIPKDTTCCLTVPK